MATYAFRTLGPLEVTMDGTPFRSEERSSGQFSQSCFSRRTESSLSGGLSTRWGEESHVRASSTLQVYVSNLRKLLEPARPAGAPFQRLITRPPGYSLVTSADELDSMAFERQVQAPRDLAVVGSYRAAGALYRDALALWRGEVLADLRSEPFAAAAAARLEELYATASEERIDAELAGRSGVELLPDIEQLIRRYPFPSGCVASRSLLSFVLGVRRMHFGLSQQRAMCSSRSSGSIRARN